MKKRTSQKKTPLTAETIILFNELIAGGTESGLNIPQCLLYASPCFDSSFKAEIDYCLNENKIGVTLQDALVNFANRVQSFHLGLSINSIRYGLMTGANICHTLRTLNMQLVRHPIGKSLPKMKYQNLTPMPDQNPTF